MVREWSVCLGGDPLSVARTCDVHVQLALSACADTAKAFCLKICFAEKRSHIVEFSGESRSSHTQEDMRH